MKKAGAIAPAFGVSKLDGYTDTESSVLVNEIHPAGLHQDVERFRVRVLRKEIRAGTRYLEPETCLGRISFGGGTHVFLDDLRRGLNLLLLVQTIPELENPQVCFTFVPLCIEALEERGNIGMKRCLGHIVLTFKLRCRC
jgi:hypothetical protein